MILFRICLRACSPTLSALSSRYPFSGRLSARMSRGAAPEVVHLFIMALLWLSLHPLTGPSSRLARVPLCPLSSPFTMSANLHMLQELAVRFRQLSRNLLSRIYSLPDLENQFLTINWCRLYSYVWYNCAFSCSANICYKVEEKHCSFQ